MSFLGDFVTPRLTHSKLGRRKVSDRNNDNLDPSTAYPKHTQVPTINQKKKTDATEDVMKGALYYLADFRKRKSETEQQKNTGKSSSVCNAMYEKAVEFQKDMLKNGHLVTKNPHVSFTSIY